MRRERCLCGASVSVQGRVQLIVFSMSLPTQVGKHVSAENISEMGVSATADQLEHMKSGVPPPRES